MGDPLKVLLLVIDGLGIGAMDDGDEEDLGSHTLLHVQQTAGPLEIPVLTRLGLGNVVSVPGIEPVGDGSLGAYGASELRHPGADTYMGHQELMGSTLDDLELRLLSDVRNDVVGALAEAGYATSELVEGLSPILVDSSVVIADNIEARRGLNLNVTGSLDDLGFGELTRIGEVVRSAVRVPRVIVVAGPGFGVDDMRAQLKERSSGQIGIDSPSLGVYDENYRVRHLGVNMDLSDQVATRAKAAGYDVALIGKAADVIRCDGAARSNNVPTHEVLECTSEYVKQIESGLIVANVQETDLSGHEQDAYRYARLLEEVDAFLPRLLQELGSSGVLFITGDHGNDPCIGHSQHTREKTPLLVAADGVRTVALGTRSTLADTGATIADLLHVPPVGTGTSFAPQLLGCS